MEHFDTWCESSSLTRVTHCHRTRTHPPLPRAVDGWWFNEDHHINIGVKNIDMMAQDKLIVIKRGRRQTAGLVKGPSAACQRASSRAWTKLGDLELLDHIPHD